MKHSALFIVLACVTILLPTSSKECGNAVAVQPAGTFSKKNLNDITPEGAILLSPVKGLLFQFP